MKGITCLTILLTDYCRSVTIVTKTKTTFFTRKIGQLHPKTGQVRHFFGVKNVVNFSNSSRQYSVNELLEIMAHHILRSLHNIREAEWFALIADGTRDCSGVEQFSISLRWAATDYVISEDVIAFASVEHTDAVTLTTTLRDVLIRSNLPRASL